MTSIALVNQKGGVGKTTSTVNIAGELARRGYKALIIDADSQGNATANMGITDPTFTLSDVLTGNCTVNEAITQTEIKGIDIIAANLELQYTELLISKSGTRCDNILDKAMRKLETDYDFILVDCAPSIGVMTINVLTFVQYALIPLRSDRNSIEGYGRLSDIINTVREDGNPDLAILGTFFTSFEKNTSLGRNYYERTKELFGDLFIPVSVRKNIAIQEAPLTGKPACYYDPSSPGAKDYAQLTEEILKRIRK